MKIEAEEATGAAEPRPEAVSRSRFTRRLEDVLVAISVGNLCLSAAWLNMLYDADHGYFNNVPVTAASLLALLTNAAWIALLVWAILQVKRRSQSLLADLGSGLLIAVFLLVPLEFSRIVVFHLPAGRVVGMLKSPQGLAASLLLFGLLIWRPRKMAAVPLVVAGVFSPLAVLNLIRVLLLLVGVTHLEQVGKGPPLAAPQHTVAGRPRVVWVIFDETDQRLLFERHPPNVPFPEFDRLRAEALVATNAYPPWDFTLVSLPSLISGRRFSAASPASPSELVLTALDTGAKVRWSEEPSVFSAAQQMGYNTALLGWYHPYQRVLSKALNYCLWFPIQNFESARALTYGAAIVRELGAMAGGFHIRGLYVDMCQQSLTNSLSLVTNGIYGLMLLHLPTPHLPGIYLPEQDRFTVLGIPRVKGYFNNLTFADHWLGKLRRALDDSSQSSNTWLIVSSDHSWRESRLYDNIRDLRVPFLVKAPGATRGETYSPQFDTILTQDLILAILRREITTQQDAASWLDRHRSAFIKPPDTRGDL